MLDAIVGHLAIHCRDTSRLCLLDSYARCFGIRTDDVQSSPCQHAGDRIQIAGVDVAAQPSGFKWDRPATAEGVTDSRTMAEAKDAELFNQFREALGLSAEVVVHYVPDRIE